MSDGPDDEPGPRADEPWPSEVVTSEAVGRLIEFWGFKRNMGRVWGLMYLSDQPLTARDLRDRLALSSGSVSMTLTELQRWGVVKRVWIQGSRSEHFVAEGNLWKMISRVFRERELVEIVEAIGAFEDALRRLERQPLKDDSERARAETQRARLTQLLEVARMGRALLEALVSTGRVDASGLARLLLGSDTKP